jgi:tripartite motif-containing protein 71
MSNHRVEIFDSGGTFVTNFGGFGAANGQFATPSGIATDGDDRMIVADRNNHRVQIFDSSGRLDQGLRDIR